MMFDHLILTISRWKRESQDIIAIGRGFLIRQSRKGSRMNHRGREHWNNRVPVPRLGNGGQAR